LTTTPGFIDHISLFASEVLAMKIKIHLYFQLFAKPKYLFFGIGKLQLSYVT
jgi:hypothetical protein